MYTHVCFWIYVLLHQSGCCLFFCFLCVECGSRAYADIFIWKCINISEPCTLWGQNVETSCLKTKMAAGKTRERVDSCHVLRVGLCFSVVAHSDVVDEGTGGDGLRRGGERNWAMIEKGWSKGRQETQRMLSVVTSVWVAEWRIWTRSRFYFKFGRWIGEDGLHLYPHYQGETHLSVRTKPSLSFIQKLPRNLTFLS